jgi:hypothetical protein
MVGILSGMFGKPRQKSNSLVFERAEERSKDLQYKKGDAVAHMFANGEVHTGEFKLGYLENAHLHSWLLRLTEMT